MLRKLMSIKLEFLEHFFYGGVTIAWTRSIHKSSIDISILGLLTTITMRIERSFALLFLSHIINSPLELMIYVGSYKKCPLKGQKKKFLVRRTYLGC